MLSAPTFAICPLSCGCLSMSITYFHNCEMQVTWKTYVSILFICGVRIPLLWLSFRQFSFIPHTQIFTLTHLDAQDYCPLVQAVINSNNSNDMLHSPSGFPSRISRRIIGCFCLIWASFSLFICRQLDTFTYRLLKAVSCSYHVANLYCAGDFWAHAVT